MVSVMMAVEASFIMERRPSSSAYAWSQMSLYAEAAGLADAAVDAGLGARATTVVGLVGRRKTIGTVG